MMFKIIVAGTRTFNDYELLKKKLDFYLQNKKNILIISSGSTGADELGVRYAHEKGFIIKQMDAEQSRYGESAELMRNMRMAQEADACIVFWDGVSKEPMDMIKSAREYNLPLKIVRYS